MGREHGLVADPDKKQHAQPLPRVGREHGLVADPVEQQKKEQVQHDETTQA